MSNRKFIYDFFRGGFLVDDTAVKNWRIIIFVVSLLLIMIWSSHLVDAKVVRIAELNKIKRELRADNIDTSTRLMQLKLESTVRNRVKSKGLEPLKNPPQKIKVTIKQ